MIQYTPSSNNNAFIHSTNSFVVTDQYQEILPNSGYVKCNLSQCFNELYIEYEKECKVLASDYTKSFVNVLYKAYSPDDARKVVMKNMINSFEFNGMICDSAINYKLYDGDYQKSKGDWINYNCYSMGNGPFSLIMHTKGSSNAESFEIVAKELGVDLAEKDVVQSQELCNHSLVSCPQPYIRKTFSKENLNQLFSKWPVGFPIFVYNLSNKFGLYSFDVFEFIYDGQVILLAGTYQQNNQIYFDESQQLIAPPNEFFIMNYHLMRANPEKDISIFDNPFMAKHFNQDNGIGLWLGDYSIIKIADLTFLKGKNVSFHFDKNNPTSMKYGEILSKKLFEIGIDVKLYPIANDNIFSIASHNGIGKMQIPSHRFLDIRKELISSFNVNRIPEMSKAEYYEKAEGIHGLRFNNNSKPISIACDIDELCDDDTDSNPIIKNLFGPGEIVIVSAEGKAGKSYLCIDLSMMISSGESIGRFSSPFPTKVLYLDAEMPPGKMHKRLSNISKLYKNKLILKQNLKIISLLRIGKRLDLSTESGRKWLEEQISNYKVLVIDNLGKVVPSSAERDPDKWREFSTFLRYLCNKYGISILLVHHNNKSGTHRGTEKIKDDVDLMVSLKRPENCPDEQTKLEVRFPYARYIYGEARKGLIIEYVSAGDNISRFLYNLDGTEVVPRIEVSSDEINRYHLSELEEFILISARNREFVVNRDFTDPSVGGRSSSTVSASLRRLVNLNLLESSGVGSGTKYRAVKDPLSVE